MKIKHSIFFLFPLFLWFLLPAVTVNAEDAFCYPGTELAENMRSIFPVGAVFYERTSQGMCVAGDYIIYTRYASDYADTTYVILDAKTKKEVSHQKFHTLHSNSLTYNPDKGEVVCVTENHAYIFNFFDGMLTLKDDIIMNHNCCKIAYIPERQTYYLGTSDTIYTSSDFYHLQALFSVNQVAVNQGMGTDGTYLYIVWYSVSRNYLSVYTLDGQYVRQYTLFSSVYREIEEVDFYEGNMIVNIANSPNKNGLYMVRAEHSYGKWQANEKPTCAKPGSKSRFCSSCGKEEQKEIPPTGKHKKGKWIITQSPFCEKQGERIKKCKVCHQIVETELLPASGHQFGPWELTKETTVFHFGTWERACITCGKTQIRKIRKLHPLITFNVSTLLLRKKQTTNCVLPRLRNGDSIKSWRSENPEIASVSKDGEITGNSYGSTTISVKSKGGAINYFKVKVKFLPIFTTKLEVKAPGLASNKMTLKKDNSMHLNITKEPLTSFNRITCKSSDETIVAVSKDGTLTAKESGSAKITVKSGFAKDTIEVFVN